MLLRKSLTLTFFILLGIALIGGVAIGGLIAWDTMFPAMRATDFTNVIFPGPDGTILHAYLAEPGDTDSTARPAIILIHEFYGLNADMVIKADRLADEGYTVMAIDAYRGQTTRLVPRAIFLVLTTPREQIAVDLDAAYTYLRSLRAIDPERIGVAGFCFGGTQAMLMGTRNPDLAANVIFYGNGPITEPAELGVIGASGPVLGIYGERDRGIPLAEVEAFQSALEARGVAAQISIYPGVGHAFVSSDLLDANGPAREAWQEMVAFLNENLQPEH
jgi:carboxymethylenebutenolidase